MPSQWRRSIMSQQHHHILLPVVVFALGFVVLATDTILNRPRGPGSSETVLITNDPAFSIHLWTIPGPGGDYGLAGFSQSQYWSRWTEIRFGSHSAAVGFSVYSVAGFVGCVLAAAGMSAASIIGRDR